MRVERAQVVGSVREGKTRKKMNSRKNEAYLGRSCHCFGKKSSNIPGRIPVTFQEEINLIFEKNKSVERKSMSRRKRVLTRSCYFRKKESVEKKYVFERK